MTRYQELTQQGMPAGLDFRVERPADWVLVPLPDEEHDFTDPLHMAPVAIVMAPWAAIVFAVAARPVYAEGTVAQWLEWSARQRGLDPGTMERQQLGPHAAVGCWGAQIEDGSVMRVRVAMFEDGDRIVVVNCMAPDALWASVAGSFAHMLRTFALEAPRGGRFALAPADLPLAENTMTAGGLQGAPAAPVAAVAPVPGPLPLPGRDGEEDAVGDASSGDEGEAAVPGVPAIRVALAADQATFDPGHACNVQMRERGAGLVPEVLHYDEQERWAGLAVPSLRATMRVPFGWHVVDDTRRTLVLDAAGHTQVRIQLLPRERRTGDAILAAKVPELQQKWPTMRHVRTVVHGMECLHVRDAQVQGQPVEQAHMLRTAPGDFVVHACVTATPSTVQRGFDLAAVLLQDLQFVDSPEA